MRAAVAAKAFIQGVQETGSTAEWKLPPREVTEASRKGGIWVDAPQIRLIMQINLSGCMRPLSPIQDENKNALNGRVTSVTGRVSERLIKFAPEETQEQQLPLTIHIEK
jgi:hypothetical protein